LHQSFVAQLPLLPEVTSKKSLVCVQMNCGSGETPSTVNAPATNGAAALVPPTSSHWPPQITAMGLLLASATEATSASIR